MMPFSRMVIDIQLDVFLSWFQWGLSAACFFPSHRPLEQIPSLPGEG